MKLNNLDMKSQFDEGVINSLSVMLLRKMGINENKSYLNESDITVLVREIQNSCYRIKQSRFEFRKSSSDFSREIVEVMDKDDDGKISMKEFLDFFGKRLAPQENFCEVVPSLDKSLSSCSLLKEAERKFDVVKGCVLSDYDGNKGKGGQVGEKRRVLGVGSKGLASNLRNEQPRSENLKENCKPMEIELTPKDDPGTPQPDANRYDSLRRTMKFENGSKRSINLAETCDDTSSKKQSNGDLEVNKLKMKPFVSFSRSIRDQVSKKSSDFYQSRKDLQPEYIKQSSFTDKTHDATLNLQKRITSENCFTKNLNEFNIKKVMSMHQVHDPIQINDPRYQKSSQKIKESEEEESEEEKEDKSILRRTMKINLNLTQIVNSDDSDSEVYTEGGKSEKSKLSKASKFVSFKENPVINLNRSVSSAENNAVGFSLGLNLSKVVDDVDEEDGNKITDFHQSIANEINSSQSSEGGRKIDVNFSNINSVHSKDNFSSSTLSPQDSAKVPKLRQQWSRSPKNYMAWGNNQPDLRGNNPQNRPNKLQNYNSINKGHEDRSFGLKKMNRSPVSMNKIQLQVGYGKRDALHTKIIERSGRSKSSNLKPVRGKRQFNSRIQNRRLNFNVLQEKSKSPENKNRSLKKSPLSKSTSNLARKRYKNKDATSNNSINLKFEEIERPIVNLFGGFDRNRGYNRRRYDAGGESYRLKKY